MFTDVYQAEMITLSKWLNKIIIIGSGVRIDQATV